MKINAVYMMHQLSSDKQKVCTERKVFCLVEESSGEFKTKIMNAVSQFLNDSIWMTLK